ncbi:hypothetical protein [Myxococcus vastator]|uniref:hypothetical protein n=1 Tax=Myxococcus vastator TaxID=2709664 RepID=UPI001F0714B5|nr:hypothetical protein [Myxococcus vastator]
MHSWWWRARTINKLPLVRQGPQERLALPDPWGPQERLALPDPWGPKGRLALPDPWGPKGRRVLRVRQGPRALGWFGGTHWVPA